MDTMIGAMIDKTSDVMGGAIISATGDTTSDVTGGTMGSTMDGDMGDSM